jgi:hypothetical protein
MARDPCKICVEKYHGEEVGVVIADRRISR